MIDAHDEDNLGRVLGRIEQAVSRLPGMEEALKEHGGSLHDLNQKVAIQNGRVASTEAAVRALQKWVHEADVETAIGKGRSKLLSTQWKILLGAIGVAGAVSGVVATVVGAIVN